MELSVIMPVYNAEQYVEKAIESVLQQSFPNFEFIIINDGSKDNSLSIINSFSDSRIIVIDQENLGLAKTLNIGLKTAKGRYVARMDADDICYPMRFQKQLDFLNKNPDVKLLGSTVERIDKDGNTITYDIPYTQHDVLKKIIFKYGNPFKHPTIVMDRVLAIKLGGYNELINKYFEDYFLWSQFCRHSKVAILPEALLRYRITPGSIMSSAADSRFIDFMLKIINKGSFDYSDREEMLSLKRTQQQSITKEGALDTYAERIDKEKRHLSSRITNFFVRCLSVNFAILLLSFAKNIASKIIK
ncbi:glycosyltransferase [Albibacterium profundi]|uniref:Glycosyltransferase n=1 Tax=Albibacterium profundi TaxID=3134906 RepID=A0ABV5C9X4_9SPHI